MKTHHSFPVVLCGSLICAVVFLSGCMPLLPRVVGPGVTQMPGPAPTEYEATAVARYKPVPVPGTQRRAAQYEAEEKARRQVLDYIGSLPAGPDGTRSVSELMNSNPQLRAKVLEYVRTACVADWAVDPCAGQVRVNVRADLLQLRAILAEFGC